MWRELGAEKELFGLRKSQMSSGSFFWLGRVGELGAEKELFRATKITEGRQVHFLGCSV